MTPIEDRLLEIADDHDRRASRLSDRKNAASERQASLAIRAALLSIATLRVERDALQAEVARLNRHADVLIKLMNLGVRPDIHEVIVRQRDDLRAENTALSETLAAANAEAVELRKHADAIERDLSEATDYVALDSEQPPVIEVWRNTLSAYREWKEVKK